MFGISIWELAIVVLVAILVIKPEDIPRVLQSVGKFLRKIRNIANEFNVILSEGDENKVKTTKIIDEFGVERQAYDIHDLGDFAAKNTNKKKDKE